MIRSSWLKLLLLSLFAYWATGTAKFVHEQLEHHGGRTARVIDDDDDDDDDGNCPPAVAAGGGHSVDPQPDHHAHPCPVCQILAAMIVDRSPPAAGPPPALRVVAVASPGARMAPAVRPAFIRLATGPPVAA